MNFTFTPKRAKFNALLCFVMIVFAKQFVFAQSVPINAAIISNQNEVDFSSNAIDGDLSTRAEIRASSGILVGIGAYSGFLELEFPSVLPANTTSYVKIDADDNLLPALLGGSLGGLLSDVLGTALIGNQEFTVQAKNGNAVVLEGNSQVTNDFASNNLRIVVNAQNEYFIAITPSQDYNRIRIRNRVGSLVGLNNTKVLGVYGAFYIQTQDNCGSASYTSFNGSGLNLDLLNLGGAGVTNPNFVIDGNPNNFSKLSLGILGVAASIEQTVYFDGLSESSDQFLVRLKVDPSLLALGVANNIQILGYNNSTLVQSVNLNSLLNLDLLTLLQNNQVATIPFSPNSPVNRITIRYNSLLNVQLTQSLDLYDIKRVPPPPVITDAFTLNPIVCAGATASLIAETDPGTTINWYSQPTGGTLLATTNSGEAFVTGVLTQDTSFYIAASDSNCPDESLRVEIAVAVVDIPTANDIIISSPLDACNGSIVLSPTTNIGGGVFKFYKDPLKTQEITTGYSGDVGVNYVLNSSTGQLTISGLTAINSPYSYYISLAINGCENEINDLKEVIVNFSSGLTLNVSSSIEGCGSVNLLDAILNLDLSGDTQYTFFDALNNAISIDVATNIVTSGIYSIQSASLLGGCVSLSQQVNVTVNQEPTLTIPNTNIIANIGDSVTLDATSNGTITWYDSNGNVLASNIVGPFTNAGLYTYTAIANNGSCSRVGTIYVTVIDSSDCPTLTERIYATSQSWGSILTGGVFNPTNAIDQNPKTFSTIVTGIGLLGVGTTWQTLEWDNTISAGTPLKVKLGSEYSGLIAAGAYSIVGTKRNISGTPEEIGTIQPISGSLLDLLPGENSFEFTFVPSDGTGPKDYDGVRIIVGSIASVAQNIKVYEAYYNEPITQLDCALGDVKDVFSGAVDLGVGVVTSTVGVDNPYDAVDDSLSTYATMYSGVGVLAAADLTIVFNTPTLENESIQLLMSRPSTILSLNLLTGFSIQMFMGDVPVGPILDNNSTLLNLELLNGGTEALLTVIPQTFNFDRIKIRFGGVAGVLDILRIHDVNRVYNTNVVDADSTNTIQACSGDTIELEVTPQDCVTFIWYDAQVGGNIVSTGTTFTIPAGLVSGSYEYYIQPVRYGCETYDRGKVTVVINNAPQNAINQVDINGSSDTDICSDLGVVTLSTQLNSSLTITNPIFYWYSFNGTTQQLIANETQSTIVLSNLSPGTHTYYVGISSDEFCQTLEGDRAEVTFTIRPFSESSDIILDDVTACSVNQVSLNPTTSLQNPQFSWFFANDTTQPIIDGSTVGNLTFTILPNGTLTITGLDVANSPYTYYVGLSSDTTCLNEAGNFKSVTITISNGTTPTTTSASQTFCLVANPTVADIQVNEPNVSWYTTPTGGTPLASTEALVDGTIYYGSIIDGLGCESGIRLEVTVSVSNGTTPTTNSTSQTFCLVANPTVTDIQVNEPNVSWYTTPTGGTPLASTEALIDGIIYYGSIVDGSGCESGIRLEVTVSVSNGTTPTTNSTSQAFCLVTNPTVADIQVNEPNVSWYTTPTGGTPLALTEALIDGTIYYGSIVDGLGCESAVRLEVTVSISNGTTPTTNSASQTFCLISNPTIADIQVNEPNVSWYTTPTGGTPLASTEALIDGTIYYGSIIDGSGCESAVRLEVTISISNGTTPTTNSTSQTFCLVANPTVADIQVNEPNVSWFTTPTGGTPLASTEALIDGAIYYGSIIDGSGCESAVRLEVTVSISNGTTPTTNSTSQAFCLVANPTVADIQVNEPNVSWYTTPTGGTPLASTEALVDGTIYYGSIIDGSGCESAVRLEVTVSISNGTTPTTNSASQTFCLISNPTVADIQVNEPNVSWFTTPTGGTPLALTEALVDGTIYYGSIVDGSGCESAVRLEVTVSISNGTTPTTNSASQTFCLISNPTVADIQVNEPNVSWYTTPTGGTPLASTEALVDGTIYYGSIIDGSGCESGIRLEVTVSISNGTTPTTNSASQTFCLVANPTVADIQVNEPNVSWYTTPTGGTPLASTEALVDGAIYYGSIIDGSGCESGIRLAVTITLLDDGNAQISGGSNESCISEQVTYTTASGMTDYIWTITNGTIVSGGQLTDDFVTVLWTSLGTGTISVSYVNSCSGISSGNLNVGIVVCSDLTISKTVNNLTPLVGENIVFTITINNVGVSQITDLVVSELLPSGYTFVSSNTSAGTYNSLNGIWNIPVIESNQSVTLLITATVLGSGNYTNIATIETSTPIDIDLNNNTAQATIQPLCLIVYNEFSPNSDGANDFFTIDCIESFPDNKLEVFNRYGVLVYSKKGYTNEWDGTANVSGTVNKDEKLPTGTYYYILDIGEKETKKNGWLSIVR
jgi:gliding motility-associated-like protein/uncharacterized repeat protein (TIGR01451 family)